MKNPGTVLIAIFAVALALLATDFVLSDWGQVVVMAILVTGVMFAAVWHRAERRLPMLSDPMILTSAFFAQFYVIGPVSLPLFDWHIHIDLTPELVLRTMAAFLLLFTCFIIAYQVRLGVMIANRLPDFARGRMKLPGRIAEAIVLLGSVAGCVLHIHNRGGLAVVLGQGYGSAPYYTGFYQVPFHGLILGTYMLAWRIADSPRTSPLTYVGFVALLLSEMVFYGVILGTRNRLFFLFFGLYTVWAMRRGITRFWKLATIPILALLLVFFAVWGVLRVKSVTQMMSGGPLDAQYGNEEKYMGYFLGVAEPFACACMVLDLFPAVAPFRYGQTLLVTVFALVPRSVWPDKPIGFGKEVTKYTDGIWYQPTHGHSLTVTFVGDFWVNAGWLGIVIGGLVFGLAARTASSYATSGMVKDGVQTSAARVLVAAVFAASLAEVRAESATILMFWGLMGPWLFLSLLFFQMNYSGQGALSPPRRAQAPMLAEEAGET